MTAQHSNIDLPGTIDKIAELAKGGNLARHEVVKIGDRSFILDRVTGDQREIRPRFEDVRKRGPDVVVRDLASVAEWSHACADEVPKAMLLGSFSLGDLMAKLEDPSDDPEVVKPEDLADDHGKLVGAEADEPSGERIGGTVEITDGEPPNEKPVGVVLIATTAGKVTRAVFPRNVQPHEKRVELTAPIYDAYLPAKGWTTYEDFLAWFDLVRGFIINKNAEQADADAVQLLDTAFASISIVEANGATIEQSGAMINVRASAEKGNGTVPNKVPKTFTARIPFGDPAARLNATFAITMKVENKAIQVRVVTLPEPLTSEWVQWATGQLKGALPEGWSVLIAP